MRRKSAKDIEKSVTGRVALVADERTESSFGCGERGCGPVIRCDAKWRRRPRRGAAARLLPYKRERSTEDGERRGLAGARLGQSAGRESVRFVRRLAVSGYPAPNLGVTRLANRSLLTWHYHEQSPRCPAGFGSVCHHASRAIAAPVSARGRHGVGVAVFGVDDHAVCAGREGVVAPCASCEAAPHAWYL